MAVTLVGLALAYLVGAVPVGLIVARAAGGVDIRRAGSGNIGATNVLRTMGWLPAVLTLVGDVVKGYVAVSLARALIDGSWGAAAGAALAVIGNCWSGFLGFRGGKGVATGLGAFLALAPWATAPTAIVFIALVATFRYVSLACVMATVCLPLGVALLGYPRASAGAALLAAAIIVLRHRENLGRLLSGTEPRLGQRASAA